jgi:nitrogen fixation protein NifB
MGERGIMQTTTSSSGCSKSSCGSSAQQMAHLPDSIREKVHNHPCYSESAHHHYARMHVAVAPACNIQCHYCNRRYDCANESRPGVVSELLQPDQAVKKILAVASAIPQMTVVGIAGPGDPLANPERTLSTFRALAETAPDIKLCLSTNGLNLPQYVDDIVKLKVDHVTITINCIDPDVGAKIYPWIFWKNKRIRGRKAAEILIQQQQRGLEMLVERGVLVKVNSVMIPGVNDQHLQEVSKTVKAKGAFLHNVMPLIAEAEHGTFFGLMGQRSPSHDELQSLQDQCAGDMNMMRHCRQCRADAVGMLGEDRGAEFSLDKVADLKVNYAEVMEKRAKIHAEIEQKRNVAAVIPLQKITRLKRQTRPVLMAIATTGQNLINQHFGHANEFLIYEGSSEGVRFVGVRKVGQYCVGTDTCGETESTLQQTIRTLKGCEVVLCSKIGFEPWGELEKAGIKPDNTHAFENIETAVADMYQKMLENGLLIEQISEVA